MVNPRAMADLNLRHIKVARHLTRKVTMTDKIMHSRNSSSLIPLAQIQLSICQLLQLEGKVLPNRHPAQLSSLRSHQASFSKMI